MELLVGTNNRGKVIEIGEALAGLPVSLITPKDVGIVDAPSEDGDTYESNAVLKARFYHARSMLPTIADDSGIIVDALQSELGIHTRRWGAGPQASDDEWISYFLQRMQHEHNKRATFICTLAYIDAAGTTWVFHGTCQGNITPGLEAPYLPGLPISACFKPDGFDAVFSALSIEQKNSISHRGRAAAQLRAHLADALSSP